MTTQTIDLPKNGAIILQELDARSKQYQKDSRSTSTKKAYRSDLELYIAWCDDNNLKSLPSEPSTVRRYITYMADNGRASSTISRAMTSISQAHKILGHATPTTHPEVTEVWKGIRRIKGISQKRAKPLMMSELKRIIQNTRPTMIGRRDAALIMIGWSGALRRSEIVSLQYSDVEFVSEGLIIHLRQSKTDQEKSGYKIGIPNGRDTKFCPVQRLKTWIKVGEISSGPLFYRIGVGGRRFLYRTKLREPLSSRMINIILTRRMERAGLSTDGYSGHSFRAGFITEAAKASVPEALIQIHTRHKTTAVMRDYIRDGSLFNQNPISVLL